MAVQLRLPPKGFRYFYLSEGVMQQMTAIQKEAPNYDEKVRVELSSGEVKEAFLSIDEDGEFWALWDSGNEIEVPVIAWEYA